MTGLHAALAAWIRHGEAVPADVTTYERSIVHEGLRALLAEHEPTPSDQALQDLRAGVEALADEWDRYAAMTDESGKEGRSVATVRRTSAVRLRDLASSAPATASEHQQRADHYQHLYEQASEGKCGYSGLTIGACKASICDCFEFPWVRPAPDEHPDPATASETFEDELDDHITESMADPEYRAAHLASCDVEDCRWCRDAATASEGATEPVTCASAGCTPCAPQCADTGVTVSDGDRPRLCCPSIIGAPHDQDCEHHETTPPASSDGDRGPSGRHQILLALAQADGQPWGSIAEASEHTAEMMYGKQADAVERILAARVDEAVGAALIVGATRTARPEGVERVEYVIDWLNNGPHPTRWRGVQSVRDTLDDARRLAACDHVHQPKITRRTTITRVEPVEDTTGGDDRG